MSGKLAGEMKGIFYSVGFRPVLGLCEPVAGLTAKWARTWWGSGLTSAFW
jgi:hypothetical protein